MQWRPKVQFSQWPGHPGSGLPADKWWIITDPGQETSANQRPGSLTPDQSEARVCQHNDMMTAQWFSTNFSATNLFYFSSKIFFWSTLQKFSRTWKNNLVLGLLKWREYKLTNERLGWLPGDQWAPGIEWHIVRVTRRGQWGLMIADCAEIAQCQCQGQLP